MKKIAVLLLLLAAPTLAEADWMQEYCDKTGGIKQAKLSSITIVSGKKAVVFIYDVIQYQDQMLRNDLAVLEEQTDIRDIEIWVNSGGGVTHTGFAIADTINAAEVRGFRMKGVARGMVASIAIPILLACDTRVASASTSFMVHEVRGETQGTRSDFRASNEFIDLQTARYIDILVDETKIKHRSKWEDWMNKTDWFTAKTALERGLIQIIE